MLALTSLVSRIVSTALGALFLMTAHPSLSFAQTKAAEGFQTLAPFAILIDAGSDTILFEKNADQLMEPASMSKLMTMEVVFQDLTEGRLKLDDEFTVSENAWRRGGAPSGGSAMFAPLRTQVKVSDLLQGVIVQSGNDACIVFAEGIAGSESAFALRMEKRARELGLIKSTFTNSTGLHDPNHRMTARELAKLAQHIIKTYPEYYKYYSQPDFTFNKIRQQNRNPLLTAGIGADGLKTGFTKEAGYGVTASAVQNGLRLIVVVNGLKTGKDRADEARKLLEWGFRSFESRRLFAADQVVGEAKVFGGAIGGVPLVGNGEIRVLVPRGSPDKMLAKIVYNGPVPAPIKQGQDVGRLKVWRGDHLALDVPLRANADVAVGSLPQRAFDAASEFAIGLFRLGTNRL